MAKLGHEPWALGPEKCLAPSHLQVGFAHLLTLKRQNKFVQIALLKALRNFGVKNKLPSRTSLKPSRPDPGQTLQPWCFDPLLSHLELSVSVLFIVPVFRIYFPTSPPLSSCTGFLLMKAPHPPCTRQAVHSLILSISFSFSGRDGFSLGFGSVFAALSTYTYNLVISADF